MVASPSIWFLLLLASRLSKKAPVGATWEGFAFGAGAVDVFPNKDPPSVFVAAGCVCGAEVVMLPNMPSEGLFGSPKREVGCGWVAVVVVLPPPKRPPPVLAGG